MSFDARSRERLEALGRTLPQPLPKPVPQQQGEPKATERRHRVEVEDNPEELFRELMQVSPDGSVPAHLMERLRELEAGRQRQERPPGGNPAPLSASAGSSAKPPERRRLGRPDPRTAAEHADLYTAFQQLLLEDEP